MAVTELAGTSNGPGGLAAGAGPSAWTWTVREHGPLRLGVLSLDAPGRELNVLTFAVLDELEAELGRLASRGVSGLAIVSGKPAGFLAGADVDAIRAVRSEAEGTAASARGQAVLGLLAKAGMPTVACIHGACVGGGAELALWCDARVASSDDRTRIGLPEVKLGIVPGFGGTQRLPRLVGLAAAIELAGSGRLVAPREALRRGLVDAVVEKEHLLAEAASLVGRLRAGRIRRPWRPSSAPLARDVVARLATARVKKISRDHYPAPAEVVRLCRLSLSARPEDGLAEEARTLGRLLAGPVARNLLHVHELQRGADRGGTEPAAEATAVILGAGVMGAGVAALAAVKGHPARVRDIDPAALARGAAVARGQARDALRRAWRPAVATAAATDRLAFSLDLSGLLTADLVLEAVVERADVKRTVLAEAERAAGAGTLLATNTSSLSVDELADALASPSRLVGLHFFNPVARMPLVEVVRGSRTDPEAVERARGWARALGKLPVVVADSPGFLVNRLLMPYLSEALVLLDEGVAIEDVDRVATDFGMPMGPFRLLDEVGLDVAGHVARTFAAAWPRRFKASALLARMVAEGRLGKKSGKGFYEKQGRRWRAWDGAQGRRARGASAPSDQEIRDRLLLRMADESLRCLDEGVAATADDVDLATVFGMGFPPFRGGLSRWIAAYGPAHVLARLEELASRHGARFEPSGRLRALSRGA